MSNPENTTTTTTATATPGAYDGYSNAETRSIIISLGGSAAQSEAASAIVAAAWWNASDEIAADRAAIVAPRADAADALRTWLEDEENPLADQCNLYSSLLEHALARVDWGAVADHFAPNPLPSIEPLPDGDADEDDFEEQEGPEPEWWRSERERED